MAKSKPSKLPAIETTEDLHATVDKVAVLEAEKRGLEAARDIDLQKVRTKHDAQIEEKGTLIKALTNLCATYCKAKKASLFGKLKSAASALARFGIREGTPALCLLNKNHTWETVLARLKDRGLTEYVRVVEEIDKEKLKGAKLTEAQLAELGLRVDTKESFFIESKSDDANRIKTATDDEV
ncbi:host-nuclease inhibitor Gam family protein [Luteolibacter sp. LG18]|uniref:host-nuclease inhibitor Gam family protein n=1 Tax=Luteolibacter sp. LG18 TaxID=2819286 RepID=UPI002B2E7F56|nr:hypothetical protein llg_07350 [Luteolibacter sp. LG18]BCU79636.1 hypothetical protein llg_43510 [Luteolibacter sp. LG18]